MSNNSKYINCWDLDINHFTVDQLWDVYKSCLQSHDWTYMYSDDPSIYKQGQKQSSRIKTLKQMLSAIDEQRANELYSSFSPWDTETGELKIVDLPL